jgi:hypothetical protein
MCVVTIQPIKMEWLISTQIVTLALLLISELLGVSASELNGILDALYKVYKKTQTRNGNGQLNV